MNIKQAEYVIFDVETTGLTPEGGDRIVEIAAIRFKNQKIVEHFESLVNPQRDIPEEAQRLHGISADMVKDAPSREEALTRMTDFINGACLVGHNIKFDLDFLCYELSLLGRKLREETPAVDTLKMAKELIPHLRSYSLPSLARGLGVLVKDSHRALADVQTTVSVFNSLLDTAFETRVESFKELYKKFGIVKPNFKIEQVNQEMLF